MVVTLHPTIPSKSTHQALDESRSRSSHLREQWQNEYRSDLSSDRSVPSNNESIIWEIFASLIPRSSCVVTTLSRSPFARYITRRWSQSRTYELLVSLPR